MPATEVPQHLLAVPSLSVLAVDDAREPTGFGPGTGVARGCGDERGMSAARQPDRIHVLAIHVELVNFGDDLFQCSWPRASAVE